jgi:cysteine desulfuration protein SufE
VPDASERPSLPAHQAACLAPFRERRDPQSRLSLAVERARSRPALPPEDRRTEWLVPGCQVRLWLVPEFRGGRCRYRVDSDAMTLKALAGLLAEVYSGFPPSEILALPADFLDELGLLRQLAESRRATVLRVADLIREHAAGCGGGDGTAGPS